MALGVVYCEEPGGTEPVFADLFQRLKRKGRRVVGTLQQSASAGGHHCDAELLILPDGPWMRIDQKLGPAARGCRLDAGALEMAVAAVERELSLGADLLVINKFGKREAEGRGFRALIAEALAQGVPVLCSVNAVNRHSFESFSALACEFLPNDPAALEDWLESGVLRRVA